MNGFSIAILMTSLCGSLAPPTCKSFEIEFLQSESCKSAYQCAVNTGDILNIKENGKVVLRVPRNALTFEQRRDLFEVIMFNIERKEKE